MIKWIKILIPLLFSLICLYLAFDKINTQEILLNLKKIKWEYFVFAFCIIIYNTWVRAQRWKLLLEQSSSISVHKLFGSTMIGYFGNSVFPFRAGEILRAYSLSKQSNILFSNALGTIILERILDMVGFLFVIFIFVSLFPFPKWMNISVMLLGIVTFTAITLIFLLGINKSKMEILIAESKLHKFNMVIKMQHIFFSFVTGATAIKRSNVRRKIFMYTIYLWLLFYFQTYLIIKMVNIDVGLIGVGVFLVGITLAIIIPSAPGYVGTYHAAVVYMSTSLFTISRPEAQILALFAHAVNFFPFLFIGFIYFLHQSMNISDIQNIKNNEKQ